MRRSQTGYIPALNETAQGEKVGYDFNVMFKFSVYTGKQERTTYRVIRTLDDQFIVQEFLPNCKEWINAFGKNGAYRDMDALFRSRHFRVLFTQI